MSFVSKRADVPPNRPDAASHGLHVLYEPENEEATVDIVAVHGLGEDAFSTWTDTDSGCLWLRDRLPKDGLMAKARIMVFGCDTKKFFQFSAYSHTLRSAKDLLHKLLDERKRVTVPPPIIFIGHSLGGLVIQSALCHAHERSTHEHKNTFVSILDSTHSLIFFGTQQQGSDDATWATYLNKLISAVGIKPTENMPGTFEIWCSEMHYINAGFSLLLDQLEITTFFETRRLRGVMVVEEAAARIGSKKERVQGLDGDHKSICRFSFDDARFLPVKQAFDSIMEKIKQNSVMYTISTKIRAEIDRSNWRALPICSASFRADWDVRGFVKTQFNDPDNVKLGTTLSVTGGCRHAQMTTVELYINQIWPNFPSCVLTTLQEAIYKKGSVFEEITEGGISFFIKTSCGGGQTHITAIGSADFLIAVAQQLAWLGSTCRAPPAEPALAYCYPTLRCLHSDDLRFEITYEPVSFGKDEETGCWISLLSSSVIAPGFPIPERQHGEVGLQIPLELMAALGDVSIAIDDGAGYILKGQTFGFYPSRKCGDTSVQWHVVHNNGEHVDFGHIPPQGQPMERLNEEELYTTTVFLGWTPKVQNFLGTTPTSKEEPHHPQAQSRGICYPAIGPSSGTNLQPNRWAWSGIAAGISKTGNAMINFTRTPREHPPPPHPTCYYDDILSSLENINVVLYDTSTKRAWLTDAERLALHVIIHRNELKNADISLSMPDPGNPESLREAMKKNRDVTVKQDYDVDESHAIKISFSKTVKEFRDKMLWLIEKSAKEKTQETSVSWSSKILGWEYMDLVKNKPSPSHSTVALEDGCGRWPDLAHQLRAAVLFGSNFQEIFRPGTPECCPRFATVPSWRSYLAVEMATLCKLAEDHTPKTSEYDPTSKKPPLRLTKSGLTWKASGQPFDLCDAAAEASCSCNPVQRISKQPQPDPELNLQNWRSGAIIFGGKLQKNAYPRRSDPSPLAGPKPGGASVTHGHVPDSDIVVDLPLRMIESELPGAENPCVPQSTSLTGLPCSECNGFVAHRGASFAEGRMG